MRLKHRVFLLCLIGVMSFTLPFYGQSASPVVFYSDLVIGPNSGGENNNGAIITLTGNNFGNSQGSSIVTIGDVPVAAYKSWSNTKIQVALGPKVQTGWMLVNVNGKYSHCGNPDPGACTFAVHPGNIFYVSPGGNDSAAGSFSAPWKTLYSAVRKVAPGDIIYAMNGINISAPDGTGWHAALLLTNDNGVVSGQPNKPIAIVAYPGATVTIGSLKSVSANGDQTIYGIRAPGGITDYVLSGLTLRGPNVAANIAGGYRWRVVNNDISATDPGAQVQGALTITQGGEDYVYGNSIHDVGTSSKEGHSVYFSTDNNHDWFGWNKLTNNTTCYELQFHSSPIQSGTGNDMYDIHVHDNYFNGDRCAGLNFATVDPSKGTVEAYNNIFFHVGNGPAPPDGNYNYACIYAAGLLNNGPAPSGTVHIYNNTAYDCGSAHTAAYSVAEINDQGAGSKLKYSFTNNIFDGKANEAPYFTFGSSANTSYLSCSNNLFYNNGSAPSYCTTKAIVANPQFVSTTTPALQIQPSSPARAAATTSSKYDYSGMVRSTPASIGAYDLVPPSGANNAADGAAPKPSAPVDLTAKLK